MTCYKVGLFDSTFLNVANQAVIGFFPLLLKTIETNYNKIRLKTNNIKVYSERILK